MTSTKLRAAVYSRMSSDRQADSPERQRSQILPYCERKEYFIVGDYEDRAVRGDAERRPGFDRLLADARANLFDVIVVDEASRFSRDDVLTYFAQVAYPLRESGVLLDTVNRGMVNWEDIGSIIVNTVQQHASSQEVVTISRRVATKLDMLARQGKMFVGRPPLGYDYATDDEGKRIGLRLAGPEEVQLVRDIFDAYVNRDLSLAALAAELSHRVAAPKGKKVWSRSTLHNILTNRVYIGDYVFGRVGKAKHYHVTATGVKAVERGRNSRRGAKVTKRNAENDWIVIPGSHEPIIESELFERAQRRLVGNRKRTSPSRKKSEYPLSQKLVCAHCGARMFATKDNGKPVYRCMSSQSNLCGNRTVREDRMMNLLLTVLEERFLAPENLERLREAVRQEHTQLNTQVETGSDVRKEQLARLENDIAKMASNLGLLDAENLPLVQLQLRKLRQEREALLAEIAERESTAPAARLEDIIENVGDFVREAKEGSPADLRSVIQETIEEVRLNIEMDQMPVYKRSRLVGGEVTLKSVVLSETGPDRARRTAPLPGWGPSLGSGCRAG